MRALVLRLWRSRIFNVLLVAVVAFWIVFVARTLLPGIRLGGPSPASLVQPKLDGVEPGVLAHIRQVRDSLDAVERNRRATGPDRAAAYGELGKVYLAYDFAEAAAACFRSAVSLDPTDFHWPYLLARSLNKDSDAQEAAGSMRSAIERMPNGPAANRAVRAAALCFAGEAAIRLNRPDEAKRAFADVLQQNPKHVFAIFKLGQIASRAGSSEEAISLFERAGRLAPARAEIQQALASEYRRHGDVQKAAAIPEPEPSKRKPRPLRYPDPLLVSVQNLNQSSTRFVRQGRQKAAAGRWSEALKLFEKAIHTDPASLPALANRGMALTMMGRAEEGQRQLEDVLRRNPTAPIARQTLCLALAELPATRPRALQEALRLRQEQPGEPAVLEALATIYARSERYREALESYREGMREAPEEIWPYAGASAMLAALGRHPEARAGLEDALGRFADDAGLRLMLARLLAASPDARTRDPKRSVEMARELMKSAPNAVRMETLAIALAADGSYDEAIGLQRQAVAAVRNVAGADLEKRAEAVLKSLENRRPWREPWPFRRLEVSSPEE